MMDRTMDHPSECNKSGCGEVKVDVEATEAYEKTNQVKIAGNRYYILIVGKTLAHHVHIRNILQEAGLEEGKSVDECDLILVFCPIVSRAGTDIEAALNELNRLSETKPVIFMVFHHTFDPEKIVPDSSKCVNRPNTLTVDLLFYEDKGLLKCIKNEKALKEIQQWLQPEVCIQGNNEQSWEFLEYIGLPSAKTMLTKLFSSIANFLSSIFLPGQTDLTVASELMIVLLGMSGSGKNAVGNIIREEMHVAGVSTDTQKITVDSGMLDKGQVSVIDTPDWFNSKLSLEEIKENIQRCIRMCSCGPYALLLVIPVMDFTDSEREMLNNMKKIFQESRWERVMILFAIDAKSKQTINGFIEKENLNKLVANYGKRFHVFNDAQLGNSPQISKLLGEIEDMVSGIANKDQESRKLTAFEIETAIKKFEKERMRKYIKVQRADSDRTVWVAMSKNSDTSDDFEIINKPEETCENNSLQMNVPNHLDKKASSMEL